MGEGSKNKTLNYLLKLPWLLDGSVRNEFLSSFYCSILLFDTNVFIVLAKIRESEGGISLYSFYGQLPDY